MSIDSESLLFHKSGKRPGKISLKPSKPLLTQTDLSLAYSPGVAAPCREIFKNQENIYEYTSKGNYVAVISNGTAVLGLGNIGPKAAKPVMEGKAVLFKKFADIDAIDLEVDTQDPEELVNIIQKIAIPWGGINLEDIKSPECFFVEQELQKRLDIPVFHDDQHGTAITAAAGLINAADLTGRDFTQMKIVINGPGAAGTACGRLLITMGINPANIIYCDRQGVLYKGRTSNMNPFKTLLAVETNARTLQDALIGADVFLGLSAKDALTPKMLEVMAEKPIIFAMANPDPEIRPELARQARPDAIIATGRSDYPNQVNNVMCFPYVFRGALDVRATEINDAMKIAAVHALAAIAREAVPEEVMRAYSNFHMYYGPDYIIPSPFDPRLLPEVSAAVAKAAMDTGVAKKPLSNIEQYKNNLEQTNDSATTTLAALYASVQSKNKRVIFAEGEEASVIRAAIHLRDADSVVPILVADQKKLEAQVRSMGIKSLKNIEVVNAATSLHNDLYIDYAYKQLNRKGFLLRDCVRAVKNKRNIFASCMLACSHGDAMITGLTRNFHRAAHEIFAVIAEPNELVFGMAINSFEDRTIFIADTAIIEQPTAEQLAEIAIQASIKVVQLGFTPRIAFIDSSNFGSHKSMDQQKIHEAMALLRDQQVSFEYDGEMSISVALNYDRMHSRYPFCNLTASANVLILPNATAANALYLMLKETSSAKVIGPILTGTAHSIQILDADSQTSDIVNAAIWAAANTEA